MKIGKQGMIKTNITSFGIKLVEGIAFYLAGKLIKYILYCLITAIQLQKNLSRYWLQQGLFWHCKRLPIGVRFRHKKTPEN